MPIPLRRVKRLPLSLPLAVILNLIFLIHKGDAATVSFNKTMMGTSIQIVIMGEPANDLTSAATAAFSEIARIEKKLSPWRQDSIISEINRYSGIRGVKTDPEIFALIQESIRFSQLSRGCFDISIQGLSDLWDFNTPDFQLPDKNKIKTRLKKVDYHKIKLDNTNLSVFLAEKGMQISLGGIAKGYAVDRAIRILRESGIKGGIVSAGGDLKTFGTKENGELWSVGVKNPRHDKNWIVRMPLSNAAVATSGDYERYRLVAGERYHHILDPRTGYPAQGCMSVSVIAKHAVEADALATAVFVQGPEEGLKTLERLTDIEGIIVDRKGAVISSSGLQKHLSESNAP